MAANTRKLIVAMLGAAALLIAVFVAYIFIQTTIQRGVAAAFVTIGQFGSSAGPPLAFSIFILPIILVFHTLARARGWRAAGYYIAATAAGGLAWAFLLGLLVFGHAASATLSAYGICGAMGAAYGYFFWLIRRPDRDARPDSVHHRAMSQIIDIWTDGACSGNPGPGGWGAVVKFAEGEIELSGGERPTTNNRMELMGAIEALRSLEGPSKVRLHTDSQYVQKGVTQWIHNWKKRGWKTADNKPVANADLWQKLEAAAAAHQVEWKWVRGHAGDVMNERADALARAAIAALR